MKKKIILIWDFDGPIGQVNSTYPYNFNFSNFEIEINNVKNLLKILDDYKIKCCFAITGFSAEKGVFPYTFPNLIKEIQNKGHEIASHSWRHEWLPLFKVNQIDKSLKRSKLALERAIDNQQEVVGFVPPHNRPMSWIQRGAFSLGDLGLFPFFKLGNNQSVISLLKQNDYRWIRVSYKNILTKLLFLKRNMTGKIFKYKNVLILENHYTGFDNKVIEHILNSNFETYTISAHPLMLSFQNKNESKENLLIFLNKLTNANQEIEFVIPSSLLS